MPAGTRKYVAITVGIVAASLLCAMLAGIAYSRLSPRGRATFQSVEEANRVFQAVPAELSRAIITAHPNPYQPSLLSNGVAANGDEAVALLKAVQNSRRIALDHPATRYYAMLTFTIDGKKLQVLAFNETNGQSCFSLFGNGHDGIHYGSFEAPDLWATIECIAKSQNAAQRNPSPSTRGTDATVTEPSG